MTTTASKLCCTCHRFKPFTDFNRRVASRDGLQARCRECSRVWYLNHQVQHIANAAVRNARLRKELRQQLADYLVAHPCIDCGEADLRVLDFDHVDPTAKTLEISKMMTNLFSWETIQQELAKCVVRCANCHRRRTFEMRSYWRHRWMLDHGLLDTPTSDAGVGQATG